MLIEGELVDLIEEFSDGKIQFAFVKVKDTNTTLPKNVLIAWVRTSKPLTAPSPDAAWSTFTLSQLQR